MSEVLSNIKKYFSAFLGIILILSSAFSYIGAQFFNLVPEHSIYVDVIAGSIGFILVFTDPFKIAMDLFEILKDKLRKK